MINSKVPIKLKSIELNNFLLNIFDMYGESFDLKNFNFYLNKNSDDIYISSTNLDNVDFNFFFSIGMFFAKFIDIDNFYLSLEGSKLINVTKNFIELKEESLSKYLSGQNLFKDDLSEINILNNNNNNYLIVKFKNKNLGSVKILDVGFQNLLPKSKLIEYGKLF